jgi:C2 domain
MRLLAVLWLVALGSTGCGVRATGEIGVLLCGNGVDDDGDELADCVDPDCWSSSACDDLTLRTQGQLDASLRMAPADDASLGDGARSEAPMATDEDAGTTEVDSSMPTSACDPEDATSCGPEDVCVEGRCIPDPFEKNVYLVRIASAFLPTRRPDTTCFETLLDGCANVLTCSDCLPDPYVITELGGDEINRTSVDYNAIAATWHDKAFTVTKVPGQVLTLRVMDDDDAPATDALIFECRVEVALLGTGSGLQCVPRLGDTFLGDYKVNIDVSPKPRSE